jgi:tRNA G18 (ribose-2'-O)-methylase SpoU
MRNKKGDMETSFEVRSFDADMSLEAYNKLPKLPLYFILDNLRSAFNVGSIFRACDILRVKGLFLCGYTAHPPHKKLEKTSLGTIDYVSWQYFKTTLEAVAHLQQRHVPVWAAETTSVSTLYTDMIYPHELGIVLGNEALGVSQEVMAQCDRIFEIPTYGFKNSLNVASACAVLGFKAMEEMSARP